jgi:hypothetical protein
MVGNVALLVDYHDSAGIPGHPERWPAGRRVRWSCPSPWLPQAVPDGLPGYNARFYFAPIEDEIG